MVRFHIPLSGVPPLLPAAREKTPTPRPRSGLYPTRTSDDGKKFATMVPKHHSCHGKETEEIIRIYHLNVVLTCCQSNSP